MRKLIAGFNLSLDGYCDHTLGIPDDDLHEHYNDLLRNADTLLYGRITYELMESYWPLIVNEPTGNKAEDDFAVLIDNISKILYSRTRDEVRWKNTELKRELVKEEVQALKSQPGKNILAGSRSMIAALTRLDLIDEYQLCIMPMIAGSGLEFFADMKQRVDLTLTNTKTFTSGAIVLYYEPKRK